MPPDELWRTPSKSYLSSVMEGGAGRAVNLGEGQRISVKGEVGNDCSSGHCPWFQRSSWKLWKMSFSHQKLLYLMCLTLWISPPSSRWVFSLGLWGLWLPRGRPLCSGADSLVQSNCDPQSLACPEHSVLFGLSSMLRPRKTFSCLARPSSWGRKEDEGVSARSIVPSCVPLGKAWVRLRWQGFRSPRVAGRQAWGCGSKCIPESQQPEAWGEWRGSRRAVTAAELWRAVED